MKKHNKNTGKIKIILIAILSVLLVLSAGTVIYIHDYYHAEAEAMTILENPQDSVTIETKNNMIIFLPEHPVAGFIFYPGGKVQCEAYAPLLEDLAAQNILCVLIRMPGNLAVLNRNAADGIPEEYPEITKWYIGGHSLGGAMAASYVSEHTDDFSGLVLLAAYSTADLSDSGLSVLSVYGTEDGVMNRDSYAKNASHLPKNSTEVLIEGGCHAQFGAYGAQDKDGTPSITGEEQIRQTADAIQKLINP